MTVQRRIVFKEITYKFLIANERTRPYHFPCVYVTYIKDIQRLKIRAYIYVK